VLCDPGLSLVAANGVPGEPRHKYRFEGTCRAQSLTTKDGKTTVNSEHLFPAVLVAAWDQSTHRFEEAFRILEPSGWASGSGVVNVAGEAEYQFTCSGDPVIGSAKCSGVVQSNETTLEFLSRPYNQGAPIAAGLATLAQATELSKAAANAPPNPPPPAPETKPKIALKSGSGVPRFALRAPESGATLTADPILVEALLFDDHARKYRVDRVYFEWQVKNESGGRPGLREPWVTRRVLGQSAWTGTDGRYYSARVSVPRARLADGRSWRLRALSTGSDVQPSDWVEFEVPPLRRSP
jgi:hypothetical protein